MRSICSGFVLVALLLTAGCSSNAQVSGKVVLDGEPVRFAELVFQSVDSDADRYTGMSLDQGKIQMSYRTRSGLPPGNYKVMITHHTLPDGQPLPMGEKRDVLIQTGKALKNVYVFEKEISAGENDMVFELTEGEKASPK